MSLLIFLFFSSVLYLACGDDTAVDAPPDYDTQVKALMDTVRGGIDEYLTPVMYDNDVDQDSQDYLKSVALSGFASYINYVLYLISEEKNPRTATVEDVVIQFDSLGPFSPFESGVPYVPPPMPSDEDIDID